MTGTGLMRGNGGGLAAGETHRDGMGGSELARSAETSATAAAEQAKATVLARFHMALMRPRNVSDARQRVLASCRRSRFAEAAIYSLPRSGQSIEGPSIRLAEELTRAMGNIDVRSTVVFEDDEKRLVRVQATDLETNVTFEAEAVVAKTIERRNPRKGDEVLGVRTNSTGEQVYIIRSRDDELLMKTNAILSRLIRNATLRLVPADILEEALDVCRATMQSEVEQDPAAARKRIEDAFAAIGVRPSELADYLGTKSLEAASPAQIAQLRQVYASVKEGVATWGEFVAERTGELPEGVEPPSTRMEAAKAAVKNRKRDAKPPAEAPPAPEAPPGDPTSEAG